MTGDVPTINTAMLSNQTYTGGPPGNQFGSMVAGITEGGLLPSGKINLDVAAELVFQEEDDMLRLVRVIIIDPDENIPLDKRVLHDGDEEFTDATDQELFFETDISAVLETHNKFRVKVRDKDVKEPISSGPWPGPPRTASTVPVLVRTTTSSLPQSPTAARPSVRSTPETTLPKLWSVSDLPRR